MEKVTGQTPMREIEIFGVPALFTEQDIPADETPPACTATNLSAPMTARRCWGRC